MTKIEIEEVHIRIISDTMNLLQNHQYYSAYLHLRIDNQDLIIAKDLYIQAQDVHNIFNMIQQPKLSVLHVSHDRLVNIPYWIVNHRPSKITLINETNLIPQSL